MELELPVAGPAYYPWGDPHGYPYGPHPMGGVGDALIRGCTNLGIGVSAGGPVAILSGSRADRPHCIYRGFCIQGCKVGAKASTLITHVPDAIKNGAELRPNCMVSRVNLGDRRVQLRRVRVPPLSIISHPYRHGANALTLVQTFADICLPCLQC